MGTFVQATHYELDNVRRVQYFTTMQLASEVTAGWDVTDWGRVVLTPHELIDASAATIEPPANDRTNEISDGYHTFAELYEQRTVLLALATAYGPMTTFRSRLHADGTMFPGMFLVETTSPGDPTGPEPVTFHVDEKHWSLFDHAHTLERAFLWDGHTSADVLNNLRAWIKFVQETWVGRISPE
jgi:hypothetical protein